MTTDYSAITVSTFARFLFGGGTVFCAVMGFVVENDPRWFAASGAFGILWWAWDFFMEYVFVPIGDWIEQLFTGYSVGVPHQDRPSLDDLIRLLESHLEQGASRQVDINSAIRLEEIYRTVKKDPEKARAVIAKVRKRYPDAPELERFGEGDGMTA